MASKRTTGGLGGVGVALKIASIGRIQGYVYLEKFVGNIW